jgi:hypothetical protein
MRAEAGRAIDAKHGRPVINVHCIRHDDMGEWKLGAPIGRIRDIGDKGVSVRRFPKSKDVSWNMTCTEVVMRRVTGLYTRYPGVLKG